MLGSTFTGTLAFAYVAQKAVLILLFRWMHVGGPER